MGDEFLRPDAFTVAGEPIHSLLQFALADLSRHSRFDGSIAIDEDRRWNRLAFREPVEVIAVRAEPYRKGDTELLRGVRNSALGFGLVHRNGNEHQVRIPA